MAEKKKVEDTTENPVASAQAALNHMAPCPSCGYCPHCGRSNARPWYPRPTYPPYGITIRPYVQPYTTWSQAGASSGATPQTAGFGGSYFNA